MARNMKDGIKVNYYLDKQIADKLEAFCDRTGRTKTKVVEIAIKEYLEKHEKDES